MGDGLGRKIFFWILLIVYSMVIFIFFFPTGSWSRAAFLWAR